MTVAIVNYRAGNLTSVRQAFERVGACPVVTSDAGVIAKAERIVVPGVGHFSRTAVLAESGLRAGILEAVKRGVPLLGICLGMQWLFSASEEALGAEGLGLVKGRCERFPAGVKSPHVGWNQLDFRGASPLLLGLPNHSFVYFSHSFRAALTEQTSAASEYGGAFSAVVERERVFGVQFHPEKSGRTGLQILKNFCALPC